MPAPASPAEVPTCDLVHLAGHVDHLVELERIDIEADEGLLRRHLERIPVVVVDGEEVSELWLDRVALEARLATVAE